MLYRPAGIYLHIPFCRRKCHYCDFNSYVSTESQRGAYVEALLTEIRWWGWLLASSSDRWTAAAPVHSVYVGGGTPSLLDPAPLVRLLEACEEEMGVEQGAEVTIEANPESASRDWLRRIQATGYNRLSLGVQSFDDRLLKGLGRLHSVADAVRCYDDARGAGFENVNLDLIFGLEGETLSQWRQSLDTAIQLAPEHLSLYGLTVEDGTPLSVKVAQASYLPADSEMSAEMYVLAEEVLAGAGYEHYEVSNWAKSGKQSRHNLNYWEVGPYLGCGAGAHSHLGQSRFWAVARPEQYVAAWQPSRLSSGHNVATGLQCRQGARSIRGAQASRPPGARGAGRMPALLEAVEPGSPYGWPLGAMAGWERVSTWTHFQERVMLGLRIIEGISLDAFRRQAGYALEDVLGAALMELRAEGLLESSRGFVRATRAGRLVLDEVLIRLFAAVEGFDVETGES